MLRREPDGARDDHCTGRRRHLDLRHGHQQGEDVHERPAVAVGGEEQRRPRQVQQQLDPRASEFTMPKSADADVQMASETPASPRAEQRDLLREASETLAAKQRDRVAASQPQPQQQRAEPASRQRSKGRAARGRREGPGLEPLTEAEREEIRAHMSRMQDEEL